MAGVSEYEEVGVVYRQHPPFRIDVELTLGCNLSCEFCGNRGIENAFAHYQHMDLQVARKICGQLYQCGWNCAIHFAGRGEPTKNVELLNIVKEFRLALPKAYLLMFTNGSGLVGGKSVGCGDLFQAGLNAICLNEYSGVQWGAKLRKHIQEHPVPGVFVYEYPKQLGGNPLQSNCKQKRICFVSAIDKNTTGVMNKRGLTNRCGAAGPLDFAYIHRRCAMPFRQMVIRWGGNLVLCCNDWRGVYKLGNLEDQSVDEIWNSLAMQAARRKLLHHQRDFPPCYGCNNPSSRLGLLPDKLGKKTLPLPDEACQCIIEQTISGDSYTPALPREWDGKARRTLV